MCGSSVVFFVYPVGMQRGLFIVFVFACAGLLALLYGDPQTTKKLKEFLILNNFFDLDSVDAQQTPE